MTFSDTLKQVIEQALDSALITSASIGFTNRVYATDINMMDFDQILTNEIQHIVDDSVKNLNGSGGVDDPIAKGLFGKGLSEGEAIGMARKTLSIVQNPASLVATGLQFLPHAALVALALSLIPIILDQLTRAGGPLDLRWKRIMQNEFNAFLDRQTQHNTQIGLRQVIVQSKAGFLSMNGAANENTLRQIREGGINKDRLANIDVKDHARGLF